MPLRVAVGGGGAMTMAEESSGAALQQQPGELHQLPGDGDDEDDGQRPRQSPRGAIQPLLSGQRL